MGFILGGGEKSLAALALVDDIEATRGWVQFTSARGLRRLPARRQNEICARAGVTFVRRARLAGISLRRRRLKWGGFVTRPGLGGTLDHKIISHPMFSTPRHNSVKDPQVERPWPVPHRRLVLESRLVSATCMRLA